MAGNRFSATIEEWVARNERALTTVVQEASQIVMDRASETVTGISRGGEFERGKIPVDTGTLAASLQSSLNGGGGFEGEGSYTAVISGAEAGDVLQFSWGGPAAAYAAAVHYGARGIPGRHWVTDAVVNWQGDVDEAARRVRSALGG